MKIVRIVLGAIIILGSIVFAAYMGIWEMFIGPILEACKHFDEGTLTALIIGKTIIKCCFASTVSGLILWLGPVIGIKVMH